MIETTPAAARPASIAERLLPALSWLPSYRGDWLLPDVLAGLAVWAVMVPEGMAYAGIVGVPPIMGLYTIVLPLIAYALLGTSRLLVVGPDTATGLISALTVGAIAVQGTPDFNALTSTLAILIGAFFLLFGALRMGWVAAFIPTPVMRGFIEGLVCVTIIGQVPHLLGIEGTSGKCCTTNQSFVKKLPEVPLMPRRCGTCPMMVTQTRPSMNPRITGAGMNAATQPMRSTPKSRNKIPIKMASVEVRVLKSVVAADTTAPTVSAEIRPVAVSGPTTSRREVPNSA